ncbi:hypothetical protein VaNZ11_002913 [Volvox africanus]|uniref:Tr-type G domain-containing protein n=1 Tax=Volvox africanus TaxID=51714 RepID=A0ABQ5RTA4_9CHLO|nr:hypothetical protein VaNZ11_002913 [Volvox africanus]
MPCGAANRRHAQIGSGSGAASASHIALTILDTPGHPDYLRNTITGITQADFAVLVVDSRPVVLESPSSCCQTRDLALLATALAHQKTLIVAINYLDVAVEADPGRAEQRFNEAADSVRKLMKRQSQSATFVPFSALAGDNLTERSPRLPWWSGPTLLEAIAAAAAATPGITGGLAATADLPLRMPLLRVYKVGGIGTVPAGRLAGGCLRQGAIVRLLPPLPPADGGVACAASPCAPSRGGLEAAVPSIECFHDSRAAAFTGEWVGLAVKGVPTWWLRRGCVVSDAADRPARLAARFTAKIQVLRDPTSKRQGRLRSLQPGYCALVHVHTAQAPCRLASIRRCNARGGVVEAEARRLQEGDIAEVELQPLVPLVVEPFREYPALGRFVVRAAMRGDNGGGGQAGAAVGSAAAMTPVIMALGRVESVTYVEDKVEHLAAGVAGPGKAPGRSTSQAGRKGQADDPPKQEGAPTGRVQHQQQQQQQQQRKQQEAMPVAAAPSAYTAPTPASDSAPSGAPPGRGRCTADGTPSRDGRGTPLKDRTGAPSHVGEGFPVVPLPVVELLSD